MGLLLLKSFPPASLTPTAQPYPPWRKCTWHFRFSHAVAGSQALTFLVHQTEPQGREGQSRGDGTLACSWVGKLEEEQGSKAPVMTHHQLAPPQPHFPLQDKAWCVKINEPWTWLRSFSLVFLKKGRESFTLGKALKRRSYLPFHPLSCVPVSFSFAANWISQCPQAWANPVSDPLLPSLSKASELQNSLSLQNSILLVTWSQLG